VDIRQVIVLLQKDLVLVNNHCIKVSEMLYTGDSMNFTRYTYVVTRHRSPAMNR